MRRFPSKIKLINYRKRWLILIFASVATLSFAFQNCGEVKFESKPVETLASQQPANGLPPSLIESGEIELKVQTREEEHLPLVKIVLVVDNSGSMSTFQSLLAQGFQSILNGFKTQRLNVEFYLYTTTTVAGVPGSSSQTLPIEYLKTEKTSATATEVKDVPHRERTKFQLAPSLSRVGELPLTIRADMTPADLASVSTALYDRVRNLGTNGSGDESGLCTLLRVAKDEGPNKFLKSGDRVAFLVLTDENDSTTASSCADFSDDIYTFVPVETKCASTTAECKSPYTYRATYVNGANIASFALTGQTQKGLCATSFVINSVTYADFFTYAKAKNPNVAVGDWRDTCVEYGMVNTLKKTSTEVILSLVETGSDPGAALKNRLDTLLGKANYKISLVINEPTVNVNHTCPSGSSTNYGYKYKTFADLSPGQAYLSSICAINYDLALGSLGSFVESIALRSYSLPLNAAAQILSIVVIRGVEEKALGVADYSISPGDSLITFREGLLQQGDTVRVKWQSVSSP